MLLMGYCRGSREFISATKSLKSVHHIEHGYVWCFLLLLFVTVSRMVAKDSFIIQILIWILFLVRFDSSSFCITCS
ncbi:hypothetical protein BDF20DRAFT_882134 [Mycotypha africana]|uniref:uncharacterized protein n=1 Tax=Mycotypha africana TaxID=64632 RepID=UPI002301AD2C|nr:uncharacterized protein BDF20DRAFT_882134 [Mycotypha africana]KAI8973393.1 hypothetical protein BDF20DRAFT_882134 [Mycotypha africana]